MSANSPTELMTLRSSIRNIVAGCDGALYQYQPASIGVADVQWGESSISSILPQIHGRSGQLFLAGWQRSVYQRVSESTEELIAAVNEELERQTNSD